MTFHLSENINNLSESLEKRLTSKTLIGKAIEIGEITLVPIIDLTFVIGTDGGSAKGTKGMGAGGGVGAKAAPAAILVMKGDSLEMLPIKSTNGLEKLIDRVPEIVSKIKDRKNENSKDKE